MVEHLELSYRTAVQLNSIIDQHLPSRPRFIWKEIVAGRESFDVYFRDVVECIRELYGNPEFAHTLVFAPKQHYVDKTKKEHLYHEMHTGDWW